MELGLDVLHREIGALHEPEAHACATARDSLQRPLAQLLRHLVRVREVRLEDAINALTQAGLEYVIVETETVDGTPEIVVSQDPVPGTEANGDTAVTLVVPAVE